MTIQTNSTCLRISACFFVCFIFSVDLNPVQLCMNTVNVAIKKINPLGGQ